SESRIIVHALNASGAQASFVELSSPFGHDAFLLEAPELNRVVDGFLRGAGAIEGFTELLRAPLAALGVPPEPLPISLIRPLSGSATLATFADLVQVHGPDSLIARTAGTIFGSTETTFYVLAVYFGAVAVRRTRHAVWAGLAADATGIVASVVICRLMFG
ncbi:MAG TPA: hypothetical protein PKE47_16230, partial [Verrucomicrobiota bacterium]|nr:hypothetical protein [Verrucomicrobiota bacterium]